MDLCDTGDCTAIADTGTSLIGVPKAGAVTVARLVLEASHSNALPCVFVVWPLIEQSVGTAHAGCIHRCLPGLCPEDALALGATGAHLSTSTKTAVSKIVTKHTRSGSHEVDDDKVPPADSSEYFDCRNQPGYGARTRLAAFPK